MPSITLTTLLSVLVLLNDLVWYFSKNLYQTYRTIQFFWVWTVYRTVSIKRPGLYSQIATARKSCKNYDQIGCLSILNSFNPSFSHSYQFKVASKSQMKLEKSNQCRLWEKFSQNSTYRTLSTPRPYFIFFQKSLLNVLYDRKKEGLNILSYRSYNRVVRIPPFINEIYVPQSF